MKRNMMISSIIMALFCLSLGFTSCSLDEEDKTVPWYSLADVYGYTFSCSFTSSSGTNLNPAITIFDESRLDWNMSVNGMGNNRYYYSAVQIAQNNWIMYWYTAGTKNEAKSLRDSNDISKASMVVRLGIDKPSQISCIVKSANDGTGSQMSSTPLSMKKVSLAKNTVPTAWEESAIKDISISVKGSAAQWNESRTFSGSFVYLVKQAGLSAVGETGDNSRPEVTVKKCGENTVTVSNVRMKVTSPMEMQLDSFDVDNVSVTKDGEVFYFSKENFMSQTKDYREDENGKKISGYRISGSSLLGKFDGSTLTLRIVFRPGSMPLDLTEIFTSN